MTNHTKYYRTVAFLAVALLLCGGCVSKTRWGVASTQKRMLRVQVGMSKQEVIKILGTPNLREVIPDKNGVPIDFLFYQTRFTGDAVLFAPKDSDLTPFAFVHDRLVGWSRNFYDNATHHEITIHETSEDKAQQGQ